MNVSARSAGAYTATLYVVIDIFVRGDRYSKRGWACTPPPPGLIFPSLWNVRQKAAVATLCVLLRFWSPLAAPRGFSRNHKTSSGFSISLLLTVPRRILHQTSWFYFRSKTISSGELASSARDGSTISNKSISYPRWAGVEDPKIMITTSRDPSSKLKQFAKVNQTLCSK